MQLVLKPEGNTRDSARDLAGHEGFTANRRLVVEKDAIAGVHPVALTVIHRDPIPVELGDRVGRPRVERGGFLLRDLLHQPVQFRRGGLIKLGFVGQSQNPDRLEQSQCAKCIAIGGVLGAVERHGDMGLCAEVVDFVRFDLLNDADEVRGVGQIAVVQHEAAVAFVWVLIQVVDSVCVEQRGAALNAVNFVPFFQQKLSQVGAILPRDAGNQCFFHYALIRCA